MRAMHELDEQQADRFRFDAGSMRSNLSKTAETHTGASGRRAETVSVRVLAAHDHDQGRAVISVRGEIDLETAPALREALSWVHEHRTGPVVVDLSEVGFMDSTGVHVLVDARQWLTLTNRRLAIACHDGGQVHRVLELLGLLDALAVHRSRERAVIGGDEILRPEPSNNGRPFERARADPQPSISSPNHKC
jgi:anti-anti-sigma factor